MASDKDLLMTLAEPGVKQELQKIQSRLNVLHRLFPHLVANEDGTVPSVFPIERKGSGGSGSKGGKGLGPAEIHAQAAQELRSQKPKGKGWGRKRSGRKRRMKPSESVPLVEKYLATHGESNSAQIGEHLGMGKSGALGILQKRPDLFVSRKSKGRNAFLLWSLKNGASTTVSNGNGGSYHAQRNVAAVIQGYLANVPSGKATVGELALVAGVDHNTVWTALRKGKYSHLFRSTASGPGKPAEWMLAPNPSMSESVFPNV